MSTSSTSWPVRNGVPVWDKFINKHRADWLDRAFRLPSLYNSIQINTPMCTTCFSALQDRGRKFCVQKLDPTNRVISSYNNCLRNGRKCSLNPRALKRPVISLLSDEEDTSTDSPSPPQQNIKRFLQDKETKKEEVKKEEGTEGKRKQLLKEMKCHLERKMSFIDQIEIAKYEQETMREEYKKQITSCKSQISRIDMLVLELSEELLKLDL